MLLAAVAAPQSACGENEAACGENEATCSLMKHMWTGSDYCLCQT